MVCLIVKARVLLIRSSAKVLFAFTKLKEETALSSRMFIE